MSLTRDTAATGEHMETVASLTMEQQLQLAAARFGGTLEAQLTAAAVATVVARMVQLSDADKHDLFECVKDLSTIRSQDDAEDTMKTILEILEPRSIDEALVGADELEKGHSEQGHKNWLMWISQKLKSLREEQGMTQNELAKASGIPQSHISRLEAGLHSPSRKTLKRLADALGIDIGQLNFL